MGPTSDETPGYLGRYLHIDACGQHEEIPCGLAFLNANIPPSLQDGPVMVFFDVRLRRGKTNMLLVLRTTKQLPR